MANYCGSSMYGVDDWTEFEKTPVIQHLTRRASCFSQMVQNVSNIYKMFLIYTKVSETIKTL